MGSFEDGNTTEVVVFFLTAFTTETLDSKFSIFNMAFRYVGGLGVASFIAFRFFHDPLPNVAADDSA